MTKRRFTRRRSAASALVLLAAITMGACVGPNDGDPHDPPALDTRLETHAVLPGQPSAAGLEYVQAIAQAHSQADRSEHQAALTILMTALERTPPAGDGTAELLHYELLARTSELMLTERDPERALRLLGPQLAPERSLPIDRGSARCLVALGDAAAQTGDHALAMSSYARALELLTLLLEEVET